ncbi:MAG: discoidin domain-containing protein, partial [Burkholderiales bacterium]|nr:discoidin domain-containing protein [Burkholderiales bacterium]
MKPHTLRQLSTHGVPLAVSLLVAACGGGSVVDAAQPTAQAGGAGAMAQALAAVAGDTEAALTPVAATASASERGDLSAAKAIDHDDGSRWSSGFSDDQWLMLDYGKVVTFSRVHIDWENAHATQYELQASSDGVAWTTIKAVASSQGGSEDWTGLAGQGRYLRMKGIKRSTQYGYSIFEIQAFSGVAPTPAPSPAP